MLKDGTLTYISLFSSAGVGCYGFKQEGYQCVATCELLEKRLDIQKHNNKCLQNSGYISGDLSKNEVKERIYSEVKKWTKNGNDRVDVLIATPPCQGISVINHKKNGNDIKRNSLVVESVELIKKIIPRFFIFENVMAFQKTLCMTADDKVMPIGDFIKSELGKDYIITGRILNFMNYGAASSRTRTIIIGVDSKYKNTISPYELFPPYQKEKTLRDVIFNQPRLKWNEICGDDFYHAFRTYDKKMIPWIHDLKEYESAFDNKEIEKRPHRVVDGKIVENIKKNRDKYTRQPWDRFIQCVHTRNDQLAAQNTIHPEQDRVFSIRELMLMMSIPEEFRWIPMSLEELNALSEKEKHTLYKQNEMTIRQCIGEAVPTAIMQQIAHAIKENIKQERLDSSIMNKIIEEKHLSDSQQLQRFINENPLNCDISSLMRLTELCNSKREENAAFYTNKFIVNEIMNYLPAFSKEELHILEPSVGAGSFLPFLFKKYEAVLHVFLDIVDIDSNSIALLEILLGKMSIPKNFTINIRCQDFLTCEFPYRFDLVVGNPPFSKLTKKLSESPLFGEENINKATRNLSEYFLEKSIRISDCVSLVLNKTILSTEEFKETRKFLRTMKIDSIVDFGRYGFTGVSIETMNIVIYPKQKPSITHIYNLKYNRFLEQKQHYITDESLPYFVIYRDENFDKVADKLEFNIFDVFRDRQITKKITDSKETKDSLWVLKARNIDDDGNGVSHIDDYDVYINREKAKSLSVYQYVNDTRIYLTPNMTYNPRVIENLPNTIVDGSVAILIPRRKGFRLSLEQKKYFSSPEYRLFYSIARNLSTQSINVDKSSVYFYGVLKV
ncbi:MAG: DNA cytosine methyltransferase [Treponema sp.]|nr:DNA cytosine methyltransferase [Treponema sp.]